ncbi:MAG: NYN domain-containing protein [Syntrophobacteraceae bacterium]
MESGSQNDEIFSKFPAQVYERIISDIPAAAWVRILASDPIVKKEVLEGFSLQPGKFSRMLYQPPIMSRLRRRLQTDKILFEKVLAEWKQEQSAVVSCLAMLDGDFIAENQRKIRGLLGPERFCVCLYLLGLLSRQWARDAIMEDDFWFQPPDESLFDLLTPILDVWGGFIETHPDLSEKFLKSKAGSGFLFDLEGDRTGQTTRRSPELREPFKKVEKKLQKAQLDLVRAGEQLNSVRSENEDLRKKLRECTAEFEKKLSHSLAQMRKEWFERYQDLDREEMLKEAERLDSLLQRTRRALELQKRADEEYGLVSDVRAKLLEVDLSLARIEAVYAGSLVVHKEVEKVKEALLTERNRLLKLPGILKVIGTHPGGGGELVARINLLDPVPGNLPKTNKLLKMIGALSEIGLASDPEQVEEAVRHKKRQIMERLYSQFEPGREDRARERQFRRLEDFISSGQSRRYDLFIDGYNVLLRVHGAEEHFSRMGFTQFREQFIEAVAARSRYFAKVYLVFDGVEDSTDVQANAEIIYTDKARSSADAVIIEKITAREDKQILLVTGDEGIISSVQDRIFALIDVVDFYMFIFE